MRQDLPVVAAAVHAAIEKDAKGRITQALERGEAADPDAYRQFIAIDRDDTLPHSVWGRDFTWRAKHYRWPDNPFTGQPMQAGTMPGDFSIRFIWYGHVSGSPDAFELTGYGADGKPVATLSESPSPTPLQP